MASRPSTRSQSRWQTDQKIQPQPPQSVDTSTSSPSAASAFFARPAAVYGAAAALRLVLLLYGLWQDAHSPVKYTDIDYLVFTDAARFVAQGASPYERATYRYTPLLAWALLPAVSGGADGGVEANRSTGWWFVVGSQLRFAAGKVLFAVADLVAGWLLERVVRESLDRKAAGTNGRGVTGSSSSRSRSTAATTARMYASVWLLNPMVAAISTRGSAEGLLGALVAALSRSTRSSFLTPARLWLAATSLVTFLSLNAGMYYLYGFPFLQHTYLHHVTRIDHRHNFSPYNTQLYLSSASAASAAAAALNAGGGLSSSARALPPVESLAFLPQLLLATVLLPLVLAKKDLAATMLAQTFAFVAFNKVCTSQYFLWYMVLLPAYLPRSSLVQRRPRTGLAALALWVAGQAAWLQQGFALEFWGRSTFVPGLWLSSLAFFLVNCWILGVIVEDVGGGGGGSGDAATA
ncbi:mannosyltransferase [Niveomyces insectorum RCEF 264]|uniref:GPI mannosyltransferase 1 n=1 Tax=Niveomyces insectorum RCEF 264 TaxID=1081102 RepID=A0A167N0R2_9HYPO|nr:mannosyltransferase [Niveomyces insectorum RCEF 264]